MQPFDRKRRVAALATALLTAGSIALTGCVSEDDGEIIVPPGSELTIPDQAQTPPPAATPVKTPEDLGPKEDGSDEPTGPRSSGPKKSKVSPQRFGLVQHSADGNRYAEGQGDVIGAEPASVQLGGTPAWVAAANRGPNTRDAVLIVALEDGSLQQIVLRDGPRLTVGRFQRAPLRPGQQPVVDAGFSPPKILRTQPRLLAPIVPGAQRIVEPVKANAISFSSQRGNNGSIARYFGPIPPDTRAMIAGKLIAVVDESTDRYPHGVLGDEIEGAQLTRRSTGQPPKTLLAPESPAVIEGTAPFLARKLGRLDRNAIVVTVSDSEQGAKLVAVDPRKGGPLAESEPIGEGQRWLHQIAAAPFAPDRETEIVSVLRPHLDATIQFHRLVRDDLVLMGELSGYPSHQLGSFNLDRAIAGDFDGSGSPEVVVPTEDGDLAGVERIAAKPGAREAYRLPLPATLSTNLAAVPVGNRLVLLAGTEDGRLLAWGR